MRPMYTKTQPLFWCQREVGKNMNGHPVGSKGYKWQKGKRVGKPCGMNYWKRSIAQDQWRESNICSYNQAFLQKAANVKNVHCSTFPRARIISHAIRDVFGGTILVRFCLVQEPNLIFEMEDHRLCDCNRESSDLINTSPTLILQNLRLLQCISKEETLDLGRLFQKV